MLSDVTSTHDKRRRTFGMEEALNDSVSIYKAALLTSDASSANLNDYVTKSKAGSAHLQFKDDLPVQLEFERALRRLNDVWRARVKGGGQRVHPQDRRSEARQTQSKVILLEEGMAPNALAYIFDTSCEAVKILRRRAGLDPNTGEETEDTKRQRLEPRIVPPV